MSTCIPDTVLTRSVIKTSKLISATLTPSTVRLELTKTNEYLKGSSLTFMMRMQFWQALLTTNGTKKPH